jgi:hypothetical protein
VLMSFESSNLDPRALLSRTMKLYVDARRPGHPGWTVVRTAEDAQRLLASGSVGTLSLDFNLGPCEDCVRFNPESARLGRCTHMRSGYDLIHWMIDTGNWPESKPVVHSADPNGASQMRSLLEHHWPVRFRGAPRRVTRSEVRQLRS